MAMYIKLAPLPIFDCNWRCIERRFAIETMVETFSFYMEGEGITNAPRMRSLFFHSARMEVQNIYKTLSDIPFQATEGETDNPL